MIPGAGPQNQAGPGGKSRGEQVFQGEISINGRNQKFQDPAAFQKALGGMGGFGGFNPGGQKFNNDGKADPDQADKPGGEARPNAPQANPPAENPQARANGVAVGDEPAAGTLILKSGERILGDIVEPSPRGSTLILVRRAWAETGVPNLLKRWDQAHAPRDRRAAQQRLKRLKEWKEERTPHVPEGALLLEEIDTAEPRPKSWPIQVLPSFRAGRC